MKKLSKEELAESAARLIKAHKTDAIYATQDGNYFLKEHEAQTHNRELNKDISDPWEVIPFEAAAAVTQAPAAVETKPETPAAEATIPAAPEKTKAPVKPKAAAPGKQAEKQKKPGKETKPAKDTTAATGEEPAEG